MGRAGEVEHLLRELEAVRVACVYGLAGTGKTALAEAVAAAVVEKRRGRVACVSCARDDVHAELALALQPGDVSVLVLDDAHVLREGDPLLASAVAAEVDAILFVSRARVLLPVPASAYASVVLAALDAESASTLLRTLTERHRSVPPVASELVRLGRTTPRTLQRAFEGAFDIVGPPGGLGAIGLGGVSDDARDALGLLAALEAPIDVEALLGLGVSKRTLTELERRFAVLASGDVVRIAPTVRAFLEGSPEGSSPAHHARWCAHFERAWRERRSHEAAARAIHHAQLAGEERVILRLAEAISDDAMGQSMLTTALEGRVSAALSTVTEGKLNAKLRRLRARLELRGGSRPRTILSRLRLLRDAGLANATDTALAAFYDGEIGAAVATLREALEQRDVPDVPRLLLTFMLVEALRGTGLSVSLDKILELSGVSGRLGPTFEAYSSVAKAFLAYNGFRFAEAYPSVGRARDAFRDAGVTELAAPIEAFFLAVAAGAGAPRGRPVVGEHRSDAFGGIGTRILEADAALFVGDAASALRSCASIEDDALALGYRRMRAWNAHVRAHALLVSGAPREAVTTATAALSDDTPKTVRARLLLEEARVRGLLTLGRTEGLEARCEALVNESASFPLVAKRFRCLGALARAWISAAPPPKRVGPTEEDHAGAGLVLDHCELLLASERPRAATRHLRRIMPMLEASSWSYHRCRAQVLLAQAWITLGRFDRASRPLAEARVHAARGSFRTLELRAALGAAATMLARGEATSAIAALEEIAAGADSHPVEQAIARAAAASAKGEPFADERVVARLGAQLGVLGRRTRELLIDGRSALLLTSTQATTFRAPRGWTFLDVERGELRRGAAVCSLRGKPATLAVLELFFQHPREVISAEVVAVQALVVADYHPLRHRSRVTMAIGRARALLGPDELVTVGDGYAARGSAPYALLRAKDA